MNTEKIWRGYWPAATTPFGKDGSLDEQAWRESLRHMVSVGAHGVLVNGSSGEWFSQTTAERQRVADISVEEAGARIPVVVGCTSYTPSEVVALAAHASSIGADGVLFTPVPYARPSEPEILDFYRTVAESVDIPIMVYNWQRGTAIDMSTDLMEKILQLPNIGAIKDSTPDYAQHLSTLHRLGRKTPFFANYISRLGIGVMTELGGVGSIEGGYLCHEHGVAFFEKYWAGDLDAAREHADIYDRQLNSFIGYNFAGRFGTQIPQIKAAMRLMGLPGGYCRSPYLDLDADAVARLREHLTSLGML